MPVGITIIGLGPGSSQHWTQAAANLLQNADEIYVRTARHPAAAEISAKIYSFDSPDSDDLSPEQIAAEIVRLGGREQGVIYAVPGHPTVAEVTVPLIRVLAKEQDLPVTIIPGLSFVEPVLDALNLAWPADLQISDAAGFAGRHHPPLEQDRPALIANLHSREVAAQVQAVLLNAYPANFTVWLVQAAGSDAEQVWDCPLSQLDTQPGLDWQTTLYLPAGTRSDFSTFQETIAHLRAPDGCPWDQEQTHQSLRPYLLEETYEVLEALDANDPVALAEELGDLLLQIMLHTQVAIDSDEFKMGDVIDHINRKLLRRHPHVFGDVVVNSVDDVANNWAAIKKAEKAEKGESDDPVHSALDGVPAAAPALAQALSVSKRAVRVGFEWPNIEGVLDKVVEEAQEIVEATEPEHLESEIGDLLFSVVNLARWRGVDAESALRATNARFTRRFKIMEAMVAANGKSLPEMTIEEMDAVWEKAKKVQGLELT